MTDTPTSFTINFDPEAAALVQAVITSPGDAAATERLMEYWAHGEGAAKIRWGTSGDFDRCVRHLSKYVADAKGLCSNLHQRATGFRPGKAPSEQKAGAPMADLLNVEIAKVGAWHLISGKLDVTPEMLADAADYARNHGRPAPVKLGHGDPRFDGEPALGWVHNLRVEGTGDDSVLVGDIRDMPAWLAEAAPKHWPDRSMEGWTNYEAEDGRTYAMVVDGLALLGVSPPGMSTLRSLRDLPQALGVAASGRIAATLNPQTPDPIDGAGSTSTTTTEGVPPMDPVKIREGLGLAADATDEDVTQAFVAAGLAPTAAAPPSTSDTSTPPATDTTDVDEAPAPVEQKVAAGTMVIDASAWAEREERIKRLEATEAKRRREERDQILTQAIQSGKFAPARVEHWKRLWDADPEGTREVVAGLTPNVVPVEAMGILGDGEDSIDEEYAHLFPPTPKGV